MAEPALPDEAYDFVCPAIPDYVDGSFLTVSPTGDQAAGQPGRVPAACFCRTASTGSGPRSLIVMASQLTENDIGTGMSR